MRQIFIAIIMVLVSNIYCQIWEYNQATAGIREIVSYSLEFNDKKLITLSNDVYSNSNPEEENWSKSIIRIFNTIDGKIIDSASYQIDTLSSSLSWIFYNKSKEEFYIIGEAHSTTLPDRRGYFLLTKWNKELNFISDTLIRLMPLDEHNIIWYLIGNQTKENEYLAIGYQNDDPQRLYINIKEILVKINAKGNIEIIKWLDKTQTTAYQSNIFYDNIIDKYIIISFYAYILNQNLEIVQVNKNMDLTNYYNGFLGLASKFSDNKYLSTVSYFNGQNHGIAFFDRDFNYIKGINFSKSKYNIQDLTIARKNYDYIDTSIIYAGNYEFYKSYITIAKLNSNLDPYWIKYYSENDSIYHYVWSLTATSDGGFVLTGGRGKLNQNGIFPEKFNAWMQKFDSDGNTVSTTEPSPNIWSITVYPNPSSGEFSINIEGKAQNTKLELYDMQGRVVKRFTGLIQGKNRLDMYDIPHGIYVWQLSRAGKKLGAGKWVKE